MTNNEKGLAQHSRNVESKCYLTFRTFRFDSLGCFLSISDANWMSISRCSTRKLSTLSCLPSASISSTRLRMALQFINSISITISSKNNKFRRNELVSYKIQPLECSIQTFNHPWHHFRNVGCFHSFQPCYDRLLRMTEYANVTQYIDRFNIVFQENGQIFSQILKFIVQHERIIGKAFRNNYWRSLE